MLTIKYEPDSIIKKKEGVRMSSLAAEYDRKTGLPVARTYLECGLPKYLQESLIQMKEAWQRIDNGEDYLHWDCDFCNLQSDINSAEVEGMISSEQAWHLREKYLRMTRPNPDDL